MEDAHEIKPHEEIAVDELVKCIEEKCASNPWQPSTTVTIFRVPEDIRKHDRDAYTPKVVSIGPFHRPSQNLQAMENHKRHYLQKFLSRGAPENDLKMYIKEMKKLEADARACYSENIKMESDEFVEMLVFDGCFIVQLLLQLEGDFEPSELIYSNKWMLPCIAHDLLLLENQIPFFVLKRLWELAGQSTYHPYDSVFDFFRNLLPGERHDCRPPCHLLHFMHSSFQPTELGLKPDRKPPPPPKTIPTAIELQEAGIKFQRRLASSFLEVTYKRGLMEMPRVTVSNYTNSLFRNFIALEHCVPKCGSHFTSYCIFMDSLINTRKDVQLLSQSGIIEHVLGSDKELAILFNNLCRGVTLDFNDSHFAGIFEGVNKHTQQSWPKYRAKLVRDYFSNPWAILSLIAAIAILILTFLQTYFSIFGYFMSP